MNKFNSYHFLTIPLFVIMISCATINSHHSESGCKKIDMTIGLSENEKKMLNAMGGEWMKDAKVCDLGEYKVAVPLNNQNGNIFIWKEEGKVFEIRNGSEFNLFGNILGSPNITPIATLHDWNDDGYLDRIFYKFIDKYGIEGDISDLNLDGTPELKIRYIDFDKNLTEAYIWLDDRWHLQERINGKIGIIIDGEWREVQLHDGNWNFSK